MGRIYACARAVFVWLGVHNITTELYNWIQHQFNYEAKVPDGCRDSWDKLRSVGEALCSKNI